MYFFIISKLRCLELQQNFPLVKFFNLISCNKGLKANISCFFLVFFVFSPIKLECSRIRKTALFLTPHRLRKYQKSVYTELHEWSENVKCWKSPIFEGKLAIVSFFQLWVKWKQSVCSITLPYSSIYFLQLVSTIFCSGDI